ncbi:MAG: quinol:electron acceptor oxidoreductase subunit ActD [Vicinamibacterales bacterium]
MTAVYGLYDDPDVAQRAVDGLRAAGAADADIVVMSSEPFEEYEFSHRDSATWLHWIAGLGGVAGFGLAYALTSYTQQAWPLVTSGMPIVAPWPNLIVIFEMTMLGAIVATVVTLFITAKLPSRLPRLYDPEVSNGYILVGVQRPAPDVAATLTAALERAGDGRVRTIE